MEDTPKRFKEAGPDMDGFADRLARLIAEYGSRYALAKASGIPVSTLQNYALGSKPGMDVLAILARVGNVDATWLLTGKGSMRGAGQLPGAALSDVVMVDQYDSKSLLVNEIPFSRRYLEGSLHLHEPTHKSLMAIESVWNLFDVVRGDLLLIDREQSTLDIDGVYLFNLPGFSLKGVFNAFQGKLRIVEPRTTRDPIASEPDHPLRDETMDSYQIDRRELLGPGPHRFSKIIGRVVWVGRAV